MPEEQQSRRPMGVVAWMTLALGAFGLFRLIPEILGVLFYLGQKSLGPKYVGLLVLDIVLEVGAVVSGIGLGRNARWATGAAVACWAAIVANSAVVLRVAGLEVLRESGNPTTLLLIPRMAFYIFSLLPSPYVFQRLYAGPIPSGKVLTILLLSSAAISALAAALALDVYPFGTLLNRN